MSKLSKPVVSHAQSLMAPFNEPIDSMIRVYPKNDLTPEETKLFWRYHGHFPQEFTQAIINLLPDQHTFVSYDHLKNQIQVV